MKGPRSLFSVLTLLALAICCKHPDVPGRHSPPDIVSGRLNAAFLIMDGVYNTELTAPMDIFHHTRFRDSIRAMNVFTVAGTRQPVRSFEGLQILPDFGYLEDSLPPIDILVVPSAEHHLDSDLQDAAMIAWVRRTAQQARIVMSLCDGAFVLATAGMPDSLRCTTFPDDIGRLREMFPGLCVLENVSFVHDGRYITSAGGDRSFDAALYLCQHLYGKKVADQLAHGLVIGWDLDSVPHWKPGD